MILSIDTTAEFGSLALTGREDVVDEVLLHSPEGFGHVLFPQIEQLLKRHGLSVHDLEGFAGASGPGSFTGVRVGLTAVKGLAFTCGKPVVAVSNLQAMASFGTAPLRAVLIDARRAEIYGAVYNQLLEIVVPEVVSKLPDWMKMLPRGELEFIAMDFEPFRSFIGEDCGQALAPRALAAAVGLIAGRQLQAGSGCDPAEIDANYIRRSDAELFWKE